MHRIGLQPTRKFITRIRWSPMDHSICLRLCNFCLDFINQFIIYSTWYIFIIHIHNFNTYIKYLDRMKRLLIPIYCQFIQCWPNLKKDILIRKKKKRRSGFSSLNPFFPLLLTVPLNYELKPDMRLLPNVSTRKVFQVARLK